ncbi:NAD-dependent epimerase/dehydratase family protein [Saccharothrix sp. 6-C]|uniref:NAD-dependent epimerase/dehydratase family protein n=1 Tax=Saccharothrix sp. 6-C TaxID=2781735 RepID=UPI0019173EAF|nr:NAD-dependent epimerase/dehydratase family protein [Saccharothrix sp. 6-C]QQQ73632.1 NAD-dependent epimerase/dehydratase family protein [Saccharothrix sp. 6-C]
MDVVVVTGSAGLVGGEAVRALASRFDLVVGVDNGMRRYLFGPAGSVADNLADVERIPNYRHHRMDVRDESALTALFGEYGSDVRLVVHTAGQPSDEWAADRPVVDLKVNAVGTMNVLEAVRRHCPSAVVVLTSTTKVYGDVSDSLPLVETDTRWEIDPAHPYHEHGIDESIRLGGNRTFAGVSKLAADLAAQSYAGLLGLRVGVFRCGSVTGARHAGVEQNGFLSHLVRSAVRGATFPVIGHGGKQVRDVLDARDLVEMFWQFYLEPRPGEVYHAGGGRERSTSILELIARYEHLTGQEVPFEHVPEHRFADVRCWITDTRKFRRDYPAWQPAHDLSDILRSVHEHWVDADMTGVDDLSDSTATP